MSFNNVEITITTANIYWKCTDEILRLSYDGAGVLTVITTFDNTPIIYNSYMNTHFKIKEIKGSIAISA